MHRSSGFTLVELMIVVAIIAVIASVAIPSLAESRKSATSTQAVRRLKVTVTVSEQYFIRFGEYASNEQNLVDAGLLPDSNNSPNAGYQYTYSSNNFSWQMSAAPRNPGVTGDNYFFVDQTGVIRFNTQQQATAVDGAID